MTSLSTMSAPVLGIVYKQGHAGRLSTLMQGIFPGGAPSGIVAKDCGIECNVNVTVPEDMEPPLLVYYELSPFYQNYNNYMRSVVQAELRGQEVPEQKREKLCKPDFTREMPGGSGIVPC